MQAEETEEGKSLVERKSGYAVLAKVENKTADQVSTAIIRRLKPIARRVRTLTYDNGEEFAEHAAIDKVLGSTAYFADPYSSWQRGSNENLNGLICHYIPKSCPFATVTGTEPEKLNGCSILFFVNVSDTKRLTRYLRTQ